MKFNFRKITSAIASTAMLGLTVATAAAANFPAPFVQNGNADVAIVYGNSLDLSAVTDISTALSSALSGSSSGAPASNEAYELFTTSTPLQLNNSLNSVRSTVTESSLPSVLSDTDFSGNVDAEAQFQITLGSNPRVIFAKEPTTSSEPGVGLTLGTTAATYLYNATITFDEVVNFTVSDSEGESITLFGQDFTVSSATDSDTLVLFKSAETLFLSVGTSSAVPSQTVEVEGNTYTVELVAASDTSATIRVTNSAGQSDQKEIDEAASKKIMGVEVAINSADESTATNSIQAEILVGADRLTFEEGDEVKVGTDNDAIDGTQVDFVTGNPAGLTQMTIQVFADSTSNDFLQAGDEFVDPVFGSFRIAFNGLAVELDDSEEREEIEISPSGTDMGAITFTSWEGETVTNFEWLNNKTGGPLGSFLGSDDDWPLYVREMATLNESSFVVVGNEDEGVLLEFTDYTNATTLYSDDEFEFTNVITGQTYTGDATSEGVGTINIEGSSYAFTYVGGPLSTEGSQYVRLNYPDSTGSNMILYPTIETSKGAKIAFYEPTTINLTAWDGTNGLLGSSIRFPDGDGYTDVALANAGGAANFSVASSSTAINTTAADGASSLTATVGKLTYNFTSTGNINQTKVYLLEGGSNVARPAIVLFEEQDEADNYNTVIVETSGAGVSDNGVSISESSFSWNGDKDMKSTSSDYGSGFELESADDMYVKLDQWGTLVTSDQTDSDQHKITLSYPGEQAVAMIYMDALVEGSGSGTLGNVRVTDDELASSGMSGKNLIVVGGSCVNSAASTLLSNAGCGASWTAATGAGSGEWIIQTFANPWASSKIATLVAGWEQGDTANAATYLTTQEPSTNVGQKLTGTTATAATSVTA